MIVITIDLAKMALVAKAFGVLAVFSVVFAFVLANCIAGVNDEEE